MGTSQLEFRELLLKIQDLLSDKDRERLLFLFGDDVPRYLRDDPSLSGTLRVLQSLFDKAIINEQDSKYLIDALRKIRCFDAAKRLQDYHQKQGTIQNVPNLSLTDILVLESEEDKMPMARGSAHRIYLESQCDRTANESTFSNIGQQQPIPTIVQPKSKITLQSMLIDRLFRKSLTYREYILLILLFITMIALPFSARPWQRSSPKILEIPKVLSTPTTNITVDSKWSNIGITLLRGYGSSNSSHLVNPTSLFINDHDVAYITDLNGHRVIQYRLNDSHFRVVAGGNGKGNRSDQLNYPNNAILDKDSNSLLICNDYDERLIRWSLKTNQNEEMTMKKIRCGDLVFDRNGFLYASDADRDEIRRFRIGETNGTVVAGGHGKGKGLNQLNSPMFFTLDDEGSIYVSDQRNHRIMKWLPGAEQGVVIAGGLGAQSGLTQLNKPMGIIVDQSKTIYVADFNNNRIIRWFEGTTTGDVIVGGVEGGNKVNQLRGPTDLAFDRQGNLYVLDHFNNRLQKYPIEKS